MTERWGYVVALPLSDYYDEEMWRRVFPPEEDEVPEKWELERIAKAQAFLDVAKPTSNYDLIHSPNAEEMVAQGFYGQSESDIVLSSNDIQILLETGVLKINVFDEYDVWLRVCGQPSNE